MTYNSFVRLFLLVCRNEKYCFIYLLLLPIYYYDKTPFKEWNILPPAPRGQKVKWACDPGSCGSVAPPRCVEYDVLLPQHVHFENSMDLFACISCILISSNWSMRSRALDQLRVLVAVDKFCIYKKYSNKNHPLGRLKFEKVCVFCWKSLNPSWAQTSGYVYGV